MKIAICATAREGGTSLQLFVPSMLAITPALVRAGHKVHMWTVEGGELQSSRAETIAGARAWGADAFYMQDTDMRVDPRVLLAMLEVDRPVVLTPYPRRHREVLFDVDTPPVPAPLRVHHRKGHRTVEVRGGGLGCCLVSRAVIDDLWADPSCEKFASGKRLELEACAMFDNLYEIRETEHGTHKHRLGEDWSFFRRVEQRWQPEALCDVSPGIVHAGVCADFAPALKRDCERRGHACEGCGA